MCLARSSSLIAAPGPRSPSGTGPSGRRATRSRAGGRWRLKVSEWCGSKPSGAQLPPRRGPIPDKAAGALPIVSDTWAMGLRRWRPVRDAAVLMDGAARAGLRH